MHTQQMQSRHISCVMAAQPQIVYNFAADPDNLPRWAHGLASAEVTRDGDDLVAMSPMGEVRVTFVPRNELGVLDHDVRLPSGQTVNNPFRVLAHPEGSEVVFTIRQLDLTDAEFDRDCQLVVDDLARLRQFVES